MLHKTIVLVLSLTLSLAAETIELSLKEFAALVAAEHHVDLVISEEVDEEGVLFHFVQERPTLMMAAFKTMLSLKGLMLRYSQIGSFYYIERKESVYPDRLHSLSLDDLIYEELKSTLDTAQVKHAYIPNTNTLTLFTDLLTFEEVQALVRGSTKRPEQFSLKMTIVETDLDKVKERGTKLSAYMQSLEGDTQYFLQLLTMPFSTTTNTFTDARQGYYSVLRYLDENGYTRLESSPYMTVQSGKELYFSAVQNIPFKTASTRVEGAAQSQSESISYQDVGLKIRLTPQIVNDTIYCDLHFTMESLIDRGSLTPSTSKREFDSEFQLRKGQILVLGGINQTDIQHTHYAIPLLERLPFLGSLFQYDHKEAVERTLTLTIEVL